MFICIEASGCPLYGRDACWVRGTVASKSRIDETTGGGYVRQVGDKAGHRIVMLEGSRGPLPIMISQSNYPATEHTLYSLPLI